MPRRRLIVLVAAVVVCALPVGRAAAHPGSGIAVDGSKVYFTDTGKGVWRIDVVATSNHATPVGHLSFVQKTGGKVAVQSQPVDQPDVMVPAFVLEHFSADDTGKLERELRRIDDQTMVGTWNAEIGPLYARFLAATPGLFRRDADKGSGRYTMRYMLTRTE